MNEGRLRSRRTVVIEKIVALLSALGAVHSYKRKKAQVKIHQQHKEFLQHRQKEEEAKLKRQKEAQKKIFRVLGQKEKKQQRSSLKGSEER